MTATRSSTVGPDPLDAVIAMVLGFAVVLTAWSFYPHPPGVHALTALLWGIVIGYVGGDE